MELNNFVCQTYHLPDKLKIQRKFFPNDPQIESFGFVCPTFLVFLWLRVLFKLISPEFFRNDFITEDFLDMQ